MDTATIVREVLRTARCGESMRETVSLMVRDSELVVLLIRVAVVAVERQGGDFDAMLDETFRTAQAARARGDLVV